MKIISNRAYIFHKTMDYIGVAILGLILLFLWQLYSGPIAIPFLKPYIIKALNHDDAEYQVTLDSVNLELVRSIKPIKIIANNVTYRKNDGSFSVNAPKTSVSFSIRALLHGVIAPSNIEVNDPRIYVFTDYGVKKEQENIANQKKLAFYFDYFEDFLERFNSDDKTYTESYVNGIEINNAEVEFHEVDLGRKWIFSDLNYRFSRNFTSIESDISALMKFDDKLASIGLDMEYKMLGEKLLLEFYFSDIVPSQFADSMPDKKLSAQLAKVDLPLSGKIDAKIDFRNVLKNKNNVAKSLDDALEEMSFSLEGGNGSIQFSEGADYKYNVASVILNGNISAGLDKVSVKDAKFDLDNQKTILNLELTGLKKYFLEQSPEDLKIAFQADIPELKFDDLYHLWPRALAEDAWLWCEDSLYGGLAQNARFNVDFAYDPKQKAIVFKDFKGRADAAGVNLNYLRGMPDIKDIYGTFSIDTKELKVVVDKGVSNGVIMTGGSVLLYDLDKEDNFADIKIVAESSITDALKLIDNPPLGFASEMGLKPGAIEGNAVTDLELKFELRNDLDTDDVNVKVKSELKDVIIPDIIKGKSVKAQALKLDVTNAGMLVEGDVTLDGSPFKLIWDENFTKEKNYNSRYQLAFVYDKAFKEKWGIDYEILNPPYIDGTADVLAEITSYPQEKMKVNLNAELTNAKLDFSFLGLNKKLGEKALLKAEIDVNNGKITSVPSLSFDKFDFNLQGKMALNKDQKVTSIDISGIRAPKTAAKAKVEFAYKPKEKIKVNISGTSYDLSAFFAPKEDEITKTSKKIRSEKNISRPKTEDKWKDITDTDINIAVNNLWTSENSMIKNFAGSAKLVKGTGIKEIRLVGNFTSSPHSYLRLNYVPHANKEFMLDIDSNDAGNTLKFLRLYDNMQGGRLNVSARRDKNQDFVGHAKIRDFSVHNTPVLAKLLTVASFSGMVNLLTGEGIKFSHFDAPFTYSNQILSVKEAKTFGNVLGITANGSYDLYYDNIDVKGVVAPAYSLNSLIGKIPLVGSLLSGKDGTVFAANYQIKGNIEDPQISLNPLSALSPSSLKDMLSSVFGENNGK